MGVVVPSVSGSNLKSTFAERGIGFIGSSPYIDEASDSFELIEKIVKASEMEATLKRLLAGEATKRRVRSRVQGNSRVGRSQSLHSTAP